MGEVNYGSLLWTETNAPVVCELIVRFYVSIHNPFHITWNVFQMKPYRLLLCSLLILSGLCPHAARPSQDYQSKLWSISKDGESRGYLLGTIHLYRPDIWRDVPGLETVMNNGLRRVVIESGQENHSLASFVSQKTFGQLAAPLQNRIIENTGRTFHDDSNLLLAVEALYSEAIDYLADDYKFEKQLIDEAQTRNIPCSILESDIEAAETADRLSLQNYEEILNAFLDYITYKNSNPRYLEELEQLYWSGILAETFIEAPDHPYKRILITSRNRTWLPRIRQHLNQEQSLIAVGENHLYGEQGLIQLLSEQGYKLVPVNTCYYDYQPWPTCAPGDEPSWSNAFHNGYRQLNALKVFYTYKLRRSYYVTQYKILRLILEDNSLLLPISAFTGMIISGIILRAAIFLRNW